MSPGWHREYARQFKKKNPDYVKEWNQRIKVEVFSHYSKGKPECACCKEKELGFLCIDHINGDGAKHRREIKKGGVGMWRWLRENGYPSGFQVLCFNCNFYKGHYTNKVCPHKIRLTYSLKGK